MTHLEVAEFKFGLRKKVNSRIIVKLRKFSSKLYCTDCLWIKWKDSITSEATSKVRYANADVEEFDDGDLKFVEKYVHASESYEIGHL